jgi:hypothetical protein
VTKRSYYSRPQRLAAVFLARQSGADAAAQAFELDPRTVRSWMDTVELPDDQWEAIQAVLLARGGELTARGETRGLVATLTAAGISSRNVRYAKLISRREARRAEEEAPPEPNPMRDAIRALSGEQKRMLVAEIDVLVETRSLGLEVGVQVPKPDDGLQMAQFLARIATLPAAEVAARTEAAKDRLRELHEAQYEQQYTERRRTAADGAAEAVEPTPQPSQPPMAPITPIRPDDRAEGVLVDIGLPTSWHSLDE